MLLVGGLMGGLTTHAAPADAKPGASRTGQSAAPKATLKRLRKAPKDESVAPATWEDRDEVRRVEPGRERNHISIGRKRFFIELSGDDGDRHLEVRDGQKLLYGIEKGSPAFAYGFHGSHVLFAGAPDSGAFAYDLASGKKLASVQDLVFAPNGDFALSPPPFEKTGCANRSRVFRIPLDGSAKPHAIDTAPMRKEVLWTEEGAIPKGNFTVAAAISPKGNDYAVLSRDELALFDAKTDRKIASFEAPPFDERVGGHNAVAFSQSGKYLVVTHADEDAGTQKTWFAWGAETKKK
jgi:hypothetical protein